MSAVWTKLEAVAAGDPAKFRKCSCGQSEHAGWTLDPAKEEISHGSTPVQGLQAALDMALERCESSEDMPEGELPLVKEGFRCALALLEKSRAYRVPRSAEEERRRFRALAWDLSRTRLDAGGYAHPIFWEDFVRGDLEEHGPKDMVERLVWHHDPRLQLVHFFSFRLFIEVQFLQRNLRIAMQKWEEAKSKKRCSTSQMDKKKDEVFELMRNAIFCVDYYMKKMVDEEEEAKSAKRRPGPSKAKTQSSVGKEKPRKEKAREAADKDALPSAKVGETGPSPPLSPAGPPLTKAQRKRAQQKANKAAVRLAKEAAASSSRSDYLPMIPAPKPLTTTPMKKKKVASSAGKTAGGSWAVVESGVEGGGEAQPSPKASEVEEAAAVALAPKEEEEEPRGESPQPVQAEVQPQTEARHSAPTEEPSEEVPTVEARRAALRLPAVKVAAPSGAYALLAHDLARIADRLRKTRIARSAR